MNYIKVTPATYVDNNTTKVNCYYSNQLLTKINRLNKRYENSNQLDLALIKKAIYYAKKYHDNQFRQSGEPYYSHPLQVAHMVCDYIFKTEAIVVSILHDTIEDTCITKEIIEADFGSSIANQVEELTRIKNGRKITSTQTLESLFSKQQYDLLLIKLVDRLHNMQTIAFKTKDKIKKTVTETLEFFIKPALYLELKDLASELQKLCHQYS
jgi:(p)ppGpp synthase/HD superfamily hydrolase